ncbi:hypothetical protein [Bacillus sp. FJAT-45037]|uniref:hypothetical protein n=1 Tax=Bacillus sp. FJAT-45037 TaxID=2011007 RepID=UPI000C246314|nr:hypothetical protein [Bacillus sp. FJAT-45037]
MSHFDPQKQQDLLEKFHYIRNQAQEDTRFEVAERMIDYGIDLNLVRTVTGLTKEQLHMRMIR